jgi:hypothetical protein
MMIAFAEKMTVVEFETMVVRMSHFEIIVAFTGWKTLVMPSLRKLKEPL